MITVRERPPLRLALDVVSPGGRHSRWGRDEHDPGNAPSGLGFSTTMPGGFEQLSCVLPRKPNLDYPDLAEFSTITAYGAGGQVGWQGRLQTSPRTSGDQVAITPGAVGWQAALEDNKSARMIYVDIDFGHWQGGSFQRQRNLDALGIDMDVASTISDQATTQPLLLTQITGSWGRQHGSEGWYNAHGLPIAAVYYGWQLAGANPADTDFHWYVALSTDDITTTQDVTADLKATGPGSGTRTALGTDRKWAYVQLLHAGAGGTAGQAYGVGWTILAVFGNHGIAPVDTAPGTIVKAYGFYASDIASHAVSTWAPELALTFNGGISSIEASTFVIPQATYLEFTTAAAIIQDVLRYEQQDWWVDEGGSNRSPTFNLCSPANHGRDWRARVGPTGLQETGPSVDRLWNEVVVTYRDVDGSTRTVGPTGSGADTTDASLSDTTSANAVTAAGLERVYAYPDIGVSTPEGAVKIGQGFLYEQAQKSTAGQAKIVGHVEDDHGVIWPAWAIRAGDRIVFTDAHSPDPRRVVRSQYDDASKANQLDLDSPPENLDSLLARYGAALTGLGVG